MVKMCVLRFYWETKLATYSSRMIKRPNCGFHRAKVPWNHQHQTAVRVCGVPRYKSPRQPLDGLLWSFLLCQGCVDVCGDTPTWNSSLVVSPLSTTSKQGGVIRFTAMTSDAFPSSSRTFMSLEQYCRMAALAQQQSHPQAHGWLCWNSGSDKYNPPGTANQLCEQETGFALTFLKSFQPPHQRF